MSDHVKREGELSGRGKCPGEYAQKGEMSRGNMSCRICLGNMCRGNMSRGICPG